MEDRKQMSFNETMKRIVRVNKEELKEQEIVAKLADDKKSDSKVKQKE